MLGPPTQLDVLVDVKRIAEKIGKAPTWAEYRLYGRYTVTDFVEFGGKARAEQLLTAIEYE